MPGEKNKYLSNNNILPLEKLKGKKIGLLGGTFDPVHYGHLLVAESIKEEYKLDKIIFIPAGNPPHKTREIKPKTSPWHRYEMLLLAINDQEDFFIWDFEIRKTSPSYTVESLNYLEEILPQTRMYFITGSDVLKEIFTWHLATELLLNYDIIVCNRGEDLSRDLTQIKEKLPQARLYPFIRPSIDISATDIRQRLAKGQSIKFLTTPAVIQYIEKHSLYK